MNLQDAIQQVITASNQSDARLKSIFKQMQDPAIGRVIHLPGGQPQEVKGPAMGDVLINVVDALRICMAGHRVTLALLAEVLNRTARHAGPTPTSEPLAQGGSQSPDFKQGDNGHPGSGSQGCNQHGSPDTPGAGNP